MGPVEITIAVQLVQLVYQLGEAASVDSFVQSAIQKLPYEGKLAE